MALITLTHATGAPGTSTTALGLALYWPRPVVLVEADVTGAAIPAGYKRGEWDLSRGLTSLAVAQYQTPEAWSLRDHTVQLSDHAEVLLGIPSISAVGSVRALWPSLTTTLTSLEDVGVDAIVDLGRLTADPDDREQLLRASDLRIMTTGTRLPDVYPARHHARRLTPYGPSAAGLTATTAMVIGSGRPYTAREVGKVTGLGVCAEIPWDPVGAEVYSVGTTPGRRHRSSSLVRAYEAAGVHIRTQIENNTQLIKGATA